MTLKELVTLRQNKFNEDIKNTTLTEFWRGYAQGWVWAYRDLKEILEYNGFDLNSIIIDNN